MLRRRSIHLYTGFGPRDRSQTEREYGRAVYGPDAADYSIEVCKGLINKAVSSLSIVLCVCSYLAFAPAIREERQ